MNNLNLILENGGWYPGRKTEIDYFIADLINNNFSVPNNTIKSFLEEFGNLEFSFSLKSGTGNIRLVMDELIPFIRESNLRIWEKFANERLAPVGTVSYDSAYLLMSYPGGFYMATDAAFYYIGKDFFDCLDHVVNEKQILRIQIK